MEYGDGFMSNGIYSDKYKLRVKKVVQLFKEENLKNSEFITFKGISGKYTLQIDSFSENIEECSYSGSKCSFLVNGSVIKTWYCIDDSAPFYELITHKNGKEYLLFRQDLYGYSVLDIKNTKIMQFFPECSLNGKETFIWTEVHYSPINNILAVFGCYWSCPYSVQLFIFDDPLNESPRFIDILSCIDESYDIYDDIEFLKWENGDLHLKAFLIENGKYTELVIPHEKYLNWLSDDNTVKYL